jgi:ribonuclease VapC
MILDSSAILAILFHEPCSERLKAALANAGSLFIGAPTLAEAKIVVGRRAGFLPGMVTSFLHALQVEVIPFGEQHSFEAHRAYERFGKGRHPAALNFGDCLCYAVAKLADDTLLCVGDDFRRTDLRLAEY